MDKLIEDLQQIELLFFKVARLDFLGLIPSNFQH